MKVVMIGATGAVGGHALERLCVQKGIDKVVLFGRRHLQTLPAVGAERIEQHVVDFADEHPYGEHLGGASAAVCTVGVGEPTKVDDETFLRIDREIPLAFAQACARATVPHFSLLSSVGVSPKSRSFYLKTKGELEESLQAMNFDRLSLFHPSMILTPTNRYGASQAVTLAVWPRLRPLLLGPARKLRGIPVAALGAAMAANLATDARGVEVLEWDHITALSKNAS